MYVTSVKYTLKLLSMQLSMQVQNLQSLSPAHVGA